MKPLISIIIPTYNRAHLIGMTLDSIIEQTLTDWECIVVDDGSKDDTAKVIEDYYQRDKRITYCTRPDSYNPGGNGARNYGLSIAKGTYIQFFDSDDLMSPVKLERQMSLLLNDRTLVVNFCSGEKVNRSSGEIRSLKRNFEENLFRQVAFSTSELMTPSFVISRQFLEEQKMLFDENLLRGQETDFLLRLSQKLKANQVSFIEDELFSYNWTEDSKSKIDETYNSRFKWSRAKIYLDIIEISIEKKYCDIFESRMQRLYRIFFSALANKDKKVFNYIFERLEQITGKKNRFLLFQLWAIIKCSAIIPLPLIKLRDHYQKRVSGILI